MTGTGSFVFFFLCRQSVRSLQGRLQPLAHLGHRLPDASPEHGRPHGRGHGAAEQRDRTQRRLPAAALSTKPAAGEPSGSTGTSERESKPALTSLPASVFEHLGPAADGCSGTSEG